MAQIFASFGAFHTRTLPIWKLAGPIILANLSVPLLGAVDTAVVGHLDSPVYLGGVALGATIFSFLYWGFGFLRMGTTALCAQARGAQDHQEMRLVFWRGSFIACVLALAILVLQESVKIGSLWIIDANSELTEQAALYYDIRVWSAPATLLNYVLLGWFLGNGDARLPFVFQIVINLTNIVLDLVFVLAIGMGVDGVALATVIAEYTGLLVGIFFLLRQPVFQETLGFNLHKIVAWRRLKRMIVVNRDIFIRTICLLIAFAYFTRTGASLGTDFVAANAILMKFMEFAAFGLDGFAHAAESLIGAAFGRKNTREVRQITHDSLILGGICALAMVLLFALTHHFIIAALTDLEAIRALSHDYVWWVIAMPILSVWCFVYDGVFLGATATNALRNAMIICLIVFVALVWWLLPLWGNHGLWASMLAFMALRGAVLAIMYPGILQSTETSVH